MSKKQKTYHGIPTLASAIVPGLGQLIKGQSGKGILVFFGMIASSVMILFLIGLITTPVLYFWQLYDAYTGQVN